MSTIVYALMTSWNLDGKKVIRNFCLIRVYVEWNELKITHQHRDSLRLSHSLGDRQWKVERRWCVVQWVRGAKCKWNVILGLSALTFFVNVSFSKVASTILWNIHFLAYFYCDLVNPKVHSFLWFHLICLQKKKKHNWVSWNSNKLRACGRLPALAIFLSRNYIPVSVWVGKGNVINKTFFSVVSNHLHIP